MENKSQLTIFLSQLKKHNLMTGFVIQGHIYEDCDKYKDTHQIKVGQDWY